MDLQAYLKNYLETWEKFHSFGFSHLVMLGIIVSCSIVIPIYAKKYLNNAQQHRLGSFAGWLVFINFLLWFPILIYSETFKIDQHLPLQLCHYGNLLIIPVMVYKNEKIFRILYFWVMAATLQAMITPDIQADAPHYWFWRYWGVHAGPVFCYIYAAVVYGFRPTPKSIWHSWLALNVVVAFTGMVNWLLGSNYAYLCRKPPVESLFDYIGPWPWYLLVAEGVALVLFGLVYLPFLASNTRKDYAG